MQFEDQVDALVDEFLDRVTPLVRDPHFKDALAQVIIRDVAWGLLDRLALSQYDFAEGIKSLAEVIEAHRGGKDSGG